MRNFRAFASEGQAKHLFVQCMEVLLPVNFDLFLLEEAFDNKAKTKIQDTVGKTDPTFFDSPYSVRSGGNVTVQQ